MGSDIMPKGNIIPVGNSGDWVVMDKARYAEKRLDTGFFDRNLSFGDT